MNTSWPLIGLLSKEMTYELFLEAVLKYCLPLASSLRGFIEFNSPSKF